MRWAERSVWSSALFLEQSLGLTGGQWEASEAFFSEPF